MGSFMGWMMQPWRGWYHVNGNTYGTWLRGDVRGWRARKHREHCEGDYKTPPPPGTYRELHQLSQARMKHNPVLLDAETMTIAGQALVERLLWQQIKVISVALDKRHYHILAKFPDTNVRWPVGLAKKHAHYALLNRGRQGPLWAKRNRILPVRNREHQVNVYHYIQNHRKRGAWVWNHRQGLYWRPGAHGT